MPDQTTAPDGELLANPKPLGTILLALVCLVIFLPAIPVGLGAAILFAIDPAAAEVVPIWQTLLISVALLFMAAVGFTFVSMAIVALWDLRLPRPVVRVDADGVFDCRLGPSPIPWSNIERVSMTRAQNSGVELRLRSPQPTPLNRFRLGGLLAWRRRDDNVAYIALHDTLGPTLDREALSRVAQNNGAEVQMHYNPSWKELRRPFPKP